MVPPDAAMMDSDSGSASDGSNADEKDSSDDGDDEEMDNDVSNYHPF